MHRSQAWSDNERINLMDKFSSAWIQGIAGRSNIERPTSNVELSKGGKHRSAFGSSMWRRKEETEIRNK
jgi:hypothetical protein